MSKDRTAISISIDLRDELESKLLAHVHSKGNRSRYLKRLIYDDLMQVQRQITTITNYMEDNEGDIEAMEGFL